MSVRIHAPTSPLDPPTPGLERRRVGRFRPETDGEISWAWDVAQPLERGLLGQLVRALDSNMDSGVTTFVASTDDEDRAMDVIRQDGWRLKHFRDNPVILDNHDPLRVVGQATRATVPNAGDDAGKLMIDVKWDLTNPDPSIQAVGHQHLNGIRRAGSVGFRPGKKTERSDLPKDHPAYRDPVEIETWWGGSFEWAGWYFEQCELLEFSSATVPMNPSALQRSYLEALGARAPDDVEGRLHVVGQTVPRSVADELRRALGDPAMRKSLVELLWPDLLAKMRTAPEYRHLHLALNEIGPPKAAAPTYFEQVALLLREET